jgi:hypothetical protein
MEILNNYLPIKVGDTLTVLNTDLDGVPINTRQAIVIHLDVTKDSAKLKLIGESECSADIPTKGPYVQGYALLQRRYSHDGFISTFAATTMEKEPISR